MMKNNLFPVAKQGWKHLAITAVAFFVAWAFDLEIIQFLLFVSFVFLLYVYRNPERLVPHFQDYSVVSPVDGVVSSIEEIQEQGYSYKIVIQGGYFDVAILRLPFTCVSTNCSLKRGTNLSTRHNLSLKLNENAEISFKGKDNNAMGVIHRLKQSIAPLDIELQDEQVQGTRYGLMVQGDTTLLLPQNFRMDIKPGDELLGGNTLIGYFTKA